MSPLRGFSKQFIYGLTISEIPTMTARNIPVRLLLVLLFFVSPAAPLLRVGNAGGFARAASRQPVRARRGMIASTDRLASQAGVEVLKRGGNAVDAAIAVALALTVTYPAAGNIGGGGFMMIRLRDGRATAIDYREMAPAAAHRDVYLDERGELKKGEGGSLVGYRASGVPGTVAGMELALKKYGSGKLTWAQLVEPARRLAAEGFPLPYNLARGLRGAAKDFEPYAESRKVYNNN